jgi:beta-N-acetylhexosaminidase
MSSTSARNWLFTVLTVSVFSFALGISMGYALWYKNQTAQPVFTPIKIVETPPADAPEETPIEVAVDPLQVDPPVDDTENEIDLPEEVAATEEVVAVEELEPLHVARHLFISVNGQWLAEGTQQLISEIQPGGVVLQPRNINNAAQTRSLVAEIKKHAGNSGGGIFDWPLIAISHEGGSQNTLRMDISHDAATLASYQNETTVEKLGQVYAREAYSRGIGVMLGPVFDLFDEGGFDPSYAQRAFGTDQTQVASLGLAMASGIRLEGMIPVAKHFPGYGSATYDDDGIQLTLNKEVSDLARLLYPFNEATRSGIEGIVVGHVAVPALDKDYPKRPATLSPVLVEELLRNRWGYKGVILADNVARNDIIQMQSSSEAVVEALKAGCDAVLFLDPNPIQIREAVEAIRKALDTGELSRESLLASQERLEEWRTKLGATAPPEPEEILVVIEEDPPSLLAEDTSPKSEPVTNPDLEMNAEESDDVPIEEESPTLIAEEAPVPKEPDTTAEPEMGTEESDVGVEEVPLTVAAEETPPAPETETTVEPETDTEESEVAVEEKPLTIVAEEALPLSNAEIVVEKPDSISDEQHDEETPDTPKTMSDEDRMLMASAADAVRDLLLKKEMTEASSEQVEEVVASTPDETTSDTSEPPPAEVEPESTPPLEVENVEVDSSSVETDEESAPVPVDEENGADTPSEEEEIISPEPSSNESAAPTPGVVEEDIAVEVGISDVKPEEETGDDAAPAENNAKPDYIEHTVKFNETLQQIGLYYGVSTEDLTQWNKLDPPMAKQGTLLRIYLNEAAIPTVTTAQKENEATSAEQATTPSETDPDGLNKIVHTVIAGDSLSAIAARYKVKMDDIMSWNSMDNNQVQLGKKLTLFVNEQSPDQIPESSEIETLIHEVASGDTISNIARRYSTTRNKILEINGITNPNHIQLGQKLKVPAPEDQ